MALYSPMPLLILVLALSGSPTVLGVKFLASVSTVNKKPASATEEALRALDTNNNGKVEKSEVEAFAQSQGLGADEVRREFKDLDRDGDGELGPDEISGALSEPENASPSLGTPAVLSGSSPAVTPAAAVAAERSPLAFTSDASSSAAGLSASTDATMNEGLEAAGIQASLAPATSMQQNDGLSAPNLQPNPQEAAEVAAAAAAAAAPAIALDLGLSAGNNAPEQSMLVQIEAQQNAGKALAEVFARSAAKVLESRTQDVKKAEKLEQTVKTLRAQKAELQRTARDTTAAAARDAAQAVLQNTIDRVRSLEVQAEQASKEAATRRNQAKTAMESALRAQADMRASVTKLSKELSVV